MLQLDERNLRNGAPIGSGQGDEALFVKFKAVAVPDKAKSEAEGRPIFREQIEIEIMMPGNRSDVVNRKAKLAGSTPQDNDTIRFPRQWAAFKEGREQSMEGTPLEQWPALSVVQVAEFKAMKVFTVEQMAALDDNAMARCGIGTRALVEKAKAYISAAAGNAPLEKLAAENAALKEQLAALNLKVDEMARNSSAPRRESKAA